MSKSNVFYYLIVAVVYVIVFSLGPEMTPRRSGYMMGALMGLFMFPSIVALIAWLISKRSKSAFSITFNVVLTIMVVGQISGLLNRVAKESKQQASLDNLSSAKEQMKIDFKEADDTESYNDAYDEFASSVKDELRQMSESTAGSERRFYELMEEFVAESEDFANSWSDSYFAIQDPRILDYSVLVNLEEFEYQRGVFRHYISLTHEYSDFISRMVPRLKNKLAELGPNSGLAKGAIEGAEENYIKQKPIFEKLMETHLSYGNNLMELVDFLESNLDKWSYQDDEILFSDDELIETFNQILNRAIEDEESINVLADQLVDTF